MCTSPSESLQPRRPGIGSTARDVSRSKQDNDLKNKLFVHVDPHAFVTVGSDLRLTTPPASVPFPFNQNAVSSGSPLPVLVQISGGHLSPVFYVGDVGTAGATGRVWKWTSGLAAWRQLVPSADGPATFAVRFFADPYDQSIVYVVDKDGIKRSDDGGDTWKVDAALDDLATEHGVFSYNPGGGPTGLAVLRDMVFDRLSPERVALGNAGVFLSTDGAGWTRLLSSTAVPGPPVSAYLDSVTSACEHDPYVAADGASVLRIGPLPTTC